MVRRRRNSTAVPAGTFRNPRESQFVHGLFIQSFQSFFSGINCASGVGACEGGGEGSSDKRNRRAAASGSPLYSWIRIYYSPVAVESVWEAAADFCSRNCGVRWIGGKLSGGKEPGAACSGTGFLSSGGK